MKAYEAWKPAEPDRSAAALEADLRHFEKFLEARPDCLPTLRVVLTIRVQLGRLTQEAADSLYEGREADLKAAADEQHAQMGSRLGELI